MVKLIEKLKARHAQHLRRRERIKGYLAKCACTADNKQEQRQQH